MAPVHRRSQDPKEAIRWRRLGALQVTGCRREKQFDGGASCTRWRVFTGRGSPRLHYTAAQGAMQVFYDLMKRIEVVAAGASRCLVPRRLNRLAMNGLAASTAPFGMQVFDVSV
ncbi:hypothetical protein EJB05_39282 [Eragrostis curvula]|uniref:Uncharacterized protein n=1 Tax=Eragrostis curvula TaxID=38414 RepID=A0A5J9TWK8_9POAL|nr:hypothetical protein EJB05_39282 [Eragrostis curvula]